MDLYKAWLEYLKNHPDPPEEAREELQYINGLTGDEFEAVKAVLAMATERSVEFPEDDPDPDESTPVEA